MKKLPYFHLILVIGFILILVGYHKYSQNKFYQGRSFQDSLIERTEQLPLAILVAPEVQAQEPRPLVDFKGMTYYINLEEKDGVSRCYDDCVQTWIPLTFTMEEEVLSVPETHYDIEIVEREDGIYQATHKGYPLYRYVEDRQRGDKKGAERGKDWVVATLK